MEIENVLKLSGAFAVVITSLITLIKALRPKLSKQELLKIEMEAIKLASEAGVKFNEESRKKIENKVISYADRQEQNGFVFFVRACVGLIASLCMFYLAYKVQQNDGWGIWVFLLAFYGVGPVIIGLRGFENLTRRFSGRY